MGMVVLEMDVLAHCREFFLAAAVCGFADVACGLWSGKGSQAGASVLSREGWFAATFFIWDGDDNVGHLPDGVLELMWPTLADGPALVTLRPALPLGGKAPLEVVLLKLDELLHLEIGLDLVEVFPEVDLQLLHI